MKNKQGKNLSRIGGEKGEVERNQTRDGQDYWKPKSSEAGAGTSRRLGQWGATVGFRAEQDKTEAIIPRTQEDREDRRVESIQGRGKCTRKGSEACKSLACSKSTKKAGVVQRVRRGGGRRQVTG